MITSNIFSSTQYATLVQITEESSSMKFEFASKSSIARNLTLGSIVVGGVAGLLLIFASTKVARRKTTNHKGDRSVFGKKSSSTSVAGETFLAMRRFVPDFKDLQGNAKVTLAVKRYPQQSETTTALSPFTITSSTDKKDTRARGRFVNIKIENTNVSESWRFGTFRIDVQPDGRR